MRYNSKAALHALRGATALMLGATLLALSAGQASSRVVVKTPRFEASACPFALSPGLREGRDVRCGYIIVPERHEATAGPTIRLAVAIFITHVLHPSTPEIYLQGGPGYGALSEVGPAVGTGSLTIGDHDLILLDQRGVGYSVPALTCPDLAALWLNTLVTSVSRATLWAADIQAIRACRSQLTSQGIDESAYTTDESAADVQDLRIALGLKQVDLYGVSYGTTVAQVIMRKYPAGIRTVVLDSVLPVTENSFEASIERITPAITGLLQACTANRNCAATYPHVAAALSTVLQHLHAHPVTIRAVDPYNGVTYRVPISGATFLVTLYSALYDQASFLELPRLIAAARTGDYSRFAQLYSAYGFDFTQRSAGEYLSVSCSTDADDTSSDSLARAGRSLPASVRDELVQSMMLVLDECSMWHAGSVSTTLKQLVRSSIPTLVLTGPYDPITPAANASLVARYLTHSYVISVPSIGHGMRYSSSCAASIVSAFEDSPNQAPSTSCLLSLPALTSLVFP